MFLKLWFYKCLKFLFFILIPSEGNSYLNPINSLFKSIVYSANVALSLQEE